MKNIVFMPKGKILRQSLHFVPNRARKVDVYAPCVYEQGTPRTSWEDFTPT